MKLKSLLCCVFVLALAVVSCSKDDEPLPSYQFSLADVATTHDGTAQSVTFDDGVSYPLASTMRGLKADTTYRVQIAYLLDANNTVHLGSLSQLLAPKVETYPAEKVVEDPLNVLTCWQTKRYINFRLSVKGTATGKQMFGFHRAECRQNADGSRTLEVKLLHSQNEDPLYYSRELYLSLPLQDLPDNLTSQKDSVCVHVETFGGKQSYAFPL